MNKLRNILITILLLVSNFLYAECVDDVNGAFAADGGCATVIGLVGCEGNFAGTSVADECPVSCFTCPGVCGSGVCEWDETYMTCPEDCDPPSACDAAVCLNILHVDTDAGTLDIHMTNQAGCSYCTDNLWDTKQLCELYGTDPDSEAGEDVYDATWEFSTIIDSATCIAEDYNGQYFDGDVAGTQFELAGITITDASGGSAEENGWTVNKSNTCDSDIADCNTVMGFSLTGAIIEAGSGVFTTVAFSDYDGTGICFGEDTGPSGAAVISNSTGNYVAAAWGDCYGPNYDYSLIDLNSTSETFGDTISPGYFENHITLHYFGHQN